jgi:hypothetical protein
MVRASLARWSEERTAGQGEGADSNGRGVSCSSPQYRDICLVGHFFPFGILLFLDRLVGRLTEHFGFFSNHFLLSSRLSRLVG